MKELRVAYSQLYQNGLDSISHGHGQGNIFFNPIQQLAVVVDNPYRTSTVRRRC